MPWIIQKRTADILIKNAPELKEKRDFVIESQNTCQKNTQATRKNGDNLMQLAGMPSTNGIKKMESSKEDLTDKGLHQRNL